jgi:hypothetical protein
MTKLHITSRASRLRIAGLAITSFEVRAMPIDSLHCPVRDVPAFVDEVAESIAKQGLANPVIVIRGPREDLVAEGLALGGSKPTFPDTPVVNCVFGGTNRVSAAKKLGYTHIDCILLPSFELGLKLQELQRNSYSRGAETQTVGKAH